MKLKTIDHEYRSKWDDHVLSYQNTIFETLKNTFTVESIYYEDTNSKANSKINVPHKNIRKET